jgi:hypothetical protein
VLGPARQARFVTVAGHLVVDSEVPGVDVAVLRADVLERARRIRMTQTTRLRMPCTKFNGEETPFP